jgi:hypothetical protein
MANPPVEHQFNKDNAAEMGARGGRNKKGSKHLSTYIQEALTDENFELKLKDGSILREMPIKAIIKTAVAKSVSGDTRAMEWLAKHGYGEKLNLEVTDTRKEILSKYGLGEVTDAGQTKEA